MVYDQYILANKNDYSGSYTDDIMVTFSGSGLNHKKNLGSRTEPITGSVFNGFDLSYSDYIGYVHGSSVGKNNQFISFQDVGEIYYDSLVPSPIDYVIKEGASFFTHDFDFSGSNVYDKMKLPRGQSLMFAVGFKEPSRFETINSTEYKTVMGGLHFMYPFEKKYKNLLKLNNQNYFLPKIYTTELSLKIEIDMYGLNFPKISNITPVTSSNIFSGCIIVAKPNRTDFNEDYILVDMSRSFVQSYFDSMGSYAPANGLFLGFTNTIPVDEIMPFTIPSLKDTYKLFFGAYRWKDFTPFGLFGEDAPAKNISIDALGAACSGLIGNGIGIGMYGLAHMVPQGWKYGLYSAEPCPTKAVFRRNHFGYFRDMLEQRQFTKFRLSEKNTITTSPVTVTFLSGTDAYVTHSNDELNVRDSGIYRFEYNAGIPFSDN